VARLALRRRHKIGNGDERERREFEFGSEKGGLEASERPNGPLWRRISTVVQRERAHWGLSMGASRSQGAAELELTSRRGTTATGRAPADCSHSLPARPANELAGWRHEP